MVAHQVDQDGHVGVVEAHARRDTHGQDHTVVGVVAGQSLAEVVQQRAHEQQVGPAHRAHDVVGAGDCLEEVAVDGEAVERVALRFAPHAVPLGEVLHEEAVLVEQLDLRHHRVAASEQRDERVADVGRPRYRRGTCLGVEASQRRPRDRDAEVGRVGGGPEDQRRIVGRRGVGEHGDLAVAEHQPRRQGHVASGGRAPARSLCATPAPRATRRRTGWRSSAPPC